MGLDFLATPNRVYLFAPANHPRRSEKVFRVGADAAILDLEDSVAKSEKESARQRAVLALKNKASCRAFIRINDVTTEFCFGDVLAAVTSELDGIVLPKVEDIAQLKTISWMISALEKERSLPAGQIEIVPIIESAKGIDLVNDIAKADSRIRRILFGAVDYSKDLNLLPTQDEQELGFARARLVIASRLANIEPPLDSVWLNINDLKGLQKSTQRVRSLGFQGRLAIHPDQVPIIKNVFVPSAEEVELARKLVRGFEEAEGQGSASIQIDGHFVDYPVYEQALRTIAAIRD